MIDLLYLISRRLGLGTLFGSTINNPLRFVPSRYEISPLFWLSYTHLNRFVQNSLTSGLVFSNCLSSKRQVTSCCCCLAGLHSPAKHALSLLLIVYQIADTNAVLSDLAACSTMTQSFFYSFLFLRLKVLVFFQSPMSYILLYLLHNKKNL